MKAVKPATEYSRRLRTTWRRYRCSRARSHLEEQASSGRQPWIMKIMIKTWTPSRPTSPQTSGRWSRQSAKHFQAWLWLGKTFWYKSVILLLLRARILALHNFLSKYDNDENQNKRPLTVTWCVAIGAGKTLGTRNSLTHTVAHVAGRRWNQPVKKSSNDKSWPMRVVGEHL